MIDKLEDFVYRLVKDNETLKKAILLPYQAIFSQVGKLKPRVISKLEYKVYENCFFGFHDRVSLNSRGLLIAHREYDDFVNGMGLAEVGYYTLDDESSFKLISKTNCCNFQQGSMATWYDENSIIFNDSNDGNAITRVVDLEGNNIFELPFHYFSISESKRYVTAINFDCFGKGLPGYGYISKATSELIQDNNDFLIFDIESSEVIFRTNLKEIELTLNKVLNGEKYFSHSSFSPDERYCYFLYRGNDGRKNSSVLLVYDLVLNKVITLPTTGMVSHLCWLDDSVILAYCSVGNVDGYYKFYLKDGFVDVVMPVNYSALNRDGHPTSSYSIDIDDFITDCYPDKSRRQKLFFVKQGQVDVTFDVYSKFKYRGVNRVDFHPRLSQCKRYITVDSPHLKHRCQIVIKIDKY